MILPSKHIKLSESLIGLGGVLLPLLKEPKTIDQLWHLFSEKTNQSKQFPAYHGFDHVVLAVGVLFIIGAVQVNGKGEIFHAVITTQG